MRSLFNIKVNILRPVLTNDGIGYTDTPTTLHSDVSGRLNWVRAYERYIVGDKQKYYRDARFYCGPLNDVKVTDRLQYGIIIFEIVGIIDFDEVHKYMALDIKRIE